MNVAYVDVSRFLQTKSVMGFFLLLLVIMYNTMVIKASVITESMLDETYSRLVLFNGATSSKYRLDCGDSPTAYGKVSHERDFSVSNGFTISLWYYQDEEQFSTSTNEISYLLSTGSIPGTGTEVPTFALAIPGKGLVSEGHIRVYLSDNKNQGQYDFVDTNAPSPSTTWNHVVIVINPTLWPRPEIFINSERANVDITSLIPETPWWVCGSCT